MNVFRLLVVSLQGTHKHTDVGARERGVRNGTEDGPILLMHLAGAIIIGWPIAQSWVNDYANATDIFRLVQSDLKRGGVLDVADSTVGKRVPIDFQFSGILSDHRQDPNYHFPTACKLEIINMNAHDGLQRSVGIVQE